MRFDSPTGRLSNSKLPQLQNISIRTELGREIREAFVDEVSPVLLSADYSRMEERLMEYYEPGRTRRFSWAHDPDEVESLESEVEEK